MESGSNIFTQAGVPNITAIIVGAIVLLIFIGVAALFYYFQMQVLKKIPEKNRKIPPGQVWLQFIPLFNLGWQFVVVIAIADSLKLEFADRKVPVDEERPTYGLGIAMAVLQICSIIPFLGVLAALAHFICWIAYWGEAGRIQPAACRNGA